MMKGSNVTILLVLLCTVSPAARGVSVSCMMAYDEGGLPAIFKSPECHQWVAITEFLQNQSRNCMFATLQGHRQYQEDHITCNLDMKIPFTGKNGLQEATIGVAAVFDGHGGKEASEMASKVFLDYFFLHVVFSIYRQSLPDKLTMNQFPGALPLIDQALLHSVLKEALLMTIRDIDLKFSKEALYNNYISGSTATVALLLNGQFLVASIGDSKALLCSERTRLQMNSTGASTKNLYAVELTRDHHPDRPDERARVEANGGTVRVWGVPRVNGVLAVSRSIGDLYLKRYGVIAVPEVMDWETLNNTDSYLVVASDGIFESLTLQKVCNLLNDASTERNGRSKNSAICLSLSSLAECLVNVAFKKGSKDNLSAIVIPLRASSFPQEHVDELRYWRN